MFSRASEKFAAVDVSASPKFIEALHALKVPVMKTTLGGSGMVGIFLAMNSFGAVVPSFSSREEMGALKSWGLNVLSLSGGFSAAGNNLAANDYGCIANPELPRSMARRISDCLGVEVVQSRVAGYLTAGSCILATNSGFLAHNRATEAELKEVASILKVPGENCTLNAGVAFPSLGAAANSKSAVFGEASTGFEVGRASAALGLI